MKYIIPSVLGSAALVAAHGYVDSAVIGGETYEFYQPYTDPYMSPAPDRVSRFIAGNGPVRDVTSVDMTCGGDGSGSQPAALHAPAAAGSTVELTWTLWPDSHVGPVMTYMARCPDAGCQDYQPGSDAVWFKVQEGGREGVTNNWAATPLMSAGGVAQYTIPECLAPGFYLVRHEIIALHQEAEYYPGCHQLEVTGSGSSVPSNLVSFPGAYSASDAGIAYSPYQQSEEYTIPGPALFTCSGSGGSPAPPPATTPTTTPSVPSTTSAPTPVEDDDEEIIDDEDDCPVEEEEEEEDDCPVDDEEDDEEGGLSPVNDDEDDLEEDDCPVDDGEEEEEEEDDCPVEDDEDEDLEEDDEDLDDCPAEDEEDDVEEGEEDDDEYEDIEECETVPTKRQTLHERRFN